MIDRSHDPEKNKKGTLPAFAPVPRLCERHDGWTPERQRRFIEALADLGSVKAAAHAVNMAPEGAYLLRRHPAAGEFRKAWEAALKLGVQRLEDVAMERALYGIEVPVYHFGAVVGTRRVYNDRLLMFLLRNRAPRRFTADSWQNSDAATRGQLERLKKQWRAEWEEELRIKSAADSEEVLDDLDRKLEAMRERHLAAMSPRLRAAHDEMERIREEEEAARAAARAIPCQPRKPEAGDAASDADVDDDSDGDGDGEGDGDGDGTATRTAGTKPAPSRSAGPRIVALAPAGPAR